jgi:hypothetical protein
LKDTTLYNIIQIGSGFDFVKLEADVSWILFWRVLIL